MSRNKPAIVSDPPRERLVLAQFLPFRLAGSAQAVSHLIASTCEDRFGLSIAAWRLLCLLSEGESHNVEHLAGPAALSEREAHQGLAVLIARGMAMSRAPHTIAITDAGRSAHQKLAELALAAEAALLSSLSPVDVRQLHRLLSRLEGAALKLSAGAKARVNLFPS